MKILRKREIYKRTREIIKAMYNGNFNIRKNNEESKEYVTKTGVKQSCVISPLLFNVVIDDPIKRQRK